MFSFLFMALKFGMMCAVLMIVTAASAQKLPRGEIVEMSVSARRLPALRAVPPVVFQSLATVAGDPGLRWRRRRPEGVERYRDAAEKYGYVVAGSNNSRNGPWNVGLDAAAAMTADIKRRFPIDLKRMYTAGMSGGARVAIMVAQNSPEIAGVLASSAGYSTAFHRVRALSIFGSAGTEDFNYREMRSR